MLFLLDTPRPPDAIERTIRLVDFGGPGTKLFSTAKCTANSWENA